MSKGKSITLLSIISVIMAAFLALAFIRFPIGVKDYNSLLGAIKLDYDMAGGVAYTLTIHEDNEKEVKNVDSVIDSIESRLDALGYTTYVVKPIENANKAEADQNNDIKTDKQIRIEVADSAEVDSAISAVVAYGDLKFYGGTSENPTTSIMEDIQFIKDASYYGQTENGHILTFELSEEGRTAILNEIADSSTYYLKMTCGVDEHGDEIALINSQFDKSILDNNNHVLSLSVSSAESAKQMALLMTEGGIDYRYEISESVAITSPYGQDIGLKSVIAIVALVVVAIALIVLAYKGLSVMLSLAILAFILIEGWMLIAIPGVVVSMGSVAGIIASIIICILSLVVLAQRVKDEFATTEKTAKASITKGFNKAILPTVNLHVVSGMIVLTLFIFAKGFVKAFAITCGIGIVVSLLSCLVFTRMFNSLVLPLVKDKEKFLGFEKLGQKVKAEV